MIKKTILLFIVALLSFFGGAQLKQGLYPDLESSEKGVKDKDSANLKDSTELVKLNNQFVIPILEQGNVSSLVILSLSIETVEGAREAIFLKEAKLRDAFLSTLFDHANSGYFSNRFTERMKLDRLRISLRETASTVLAEPVYNVLITDLVRQDKI